MAKLEKEFAPDGLLDPALFGSGRRPATACRCRRRPPASVWAALPQRSGLPRATSARGSRPRAVLSALQGYGPGGWPRLIAEAVAAVRLSGRGAVVVVPDYRDLDRVESALLELLPAGDVARLTADDGQTPALPQFPAPPQRRRRGRRGHPVRGLRARAEPRASWSAGTTATTSTSSSAPRTRTPAKSSCSGPSQEGAACLLAAHSRSTETQRLVDAGWAQAGGSRTDGRPPDGSAGPEHRRQL